MAMRSNENDLLSGGRQPGALHAVHELIAPWQTVSALAAETGQAVMRFTGVDASTDTHGRVEQSREQYNMIPEAHERLADSDEPGFVVDSAHVSELFGKPAKGSFISGQVDPAAVQAVINKVESKMVSTDAATQVVLRFNFMTGPESKAALLFVVVAIIVGGGVLVAEFSNKMVQGAETQDGFDPFYPLYAWNAGVGSGCLLLMTVSLGSLMWCVYEAVRLHKHWKHRQRRNVILIVLEACVQWLNLILYVVPNVMLAAQPCYITTNMLYWLGFARWTCWNTVFTLFLIHAYSSRVWKGHQGDNASVSPAAIEHGFQSPEGHSKLIMDGPWWLLWPCMLLWPFFEGVMGAALIDSAAGQVNDFQNCTETGPDYRQICSQSHFVLSMMDCTVALTILYLIVTYLLLLFKLRSYKKQAYSSVQVGLVYNTLQLWLRMAVMTFFILCLVLLWLVDNQWCNTQYYSWLGLMPMQIVMTANTVVLCYIATPKTPKEHVAAAAVWLQEFAWTEGEKLVKLEARSRMAPSLASQPIFCFETMMNLLYWSCFVYDHTRELARDSQDGLDKLGPAPEEHDKSRTANSTCAAQTSLTLERALSLYQMDTSKTFYEVSQDTRCLVGWGSNSVVVAFRGTASVRNALADLQAWRMTHPPRRGNYWLGTKPMVHHGFLKSWQAGGLNLKVVDYVVEAVEQCKQAHKSEQPISVFVTGHSLGGALATLAAIDIRKHLLVRQLGDTKVVCCTFAAPRTGNHAFAREYNTMVPDTWSIINDQDVVTREGKMLFLYKRPGQRVIVNAAGRMMVRPTHMEASVQRATGGQRVRHHLLANYFHAVLCVVLAQFSGVGFSDGEDGIIRLTEASPYIKDLLERQMGMTLPDMRAFCQADPTTRAGQSLPGAHLPNKGFYMLKTLSPLSKPARSSSRRLSGLWVRSSSGPI